MQEDFYWLGFSFFKGIGPVRFKKLFDRFGSAKDAWQAAEKDLESVLEKKIVRNFLDFRETISLETYAKHLAKEEIYPLLLTDTAYPHLLKEISHPPFVLYVKGNVSLLSEDHTIGVVGTRKPTSYGEEVTKTITKDLAAAGWVIISGLALGIDSIAHESALAVQGKTIAVLGSGVDCPTPSQNGALYDRIRQHFGAIVSETAFESVSSKGMFPARNRIIAGLSMGIVVSEGMEKSGSLITAEYAKNMQRKVFAVPGPITSANSQGPLRLLTQGAIPVGSAADILHAFGTTYKGVSQKQKMQGTQEEQEIVAVLQNGSLHFDEIVHKIKKDAKKVGTILGLMELKGLIRNTGGIYSL